MNRQTIIKHISERFSIDETQATNIYDTIFSEIINCFQKEKNLNIDGFGKFIVRHRKNQKDKIEKWISYSPAKKFSDEINSQFCHLPPYTETEPVQEKISQLTENYSIEIKDTVTQTNACNEVLTEDNIETTNNKPSSTETETQNTDTREEISAVNNITSVNQNFTDKKTEFSDANEKVSKIDDIRHRYELEIEKLKMKLDDNSGDDIEKDIENFNSLRKDFAGLISKDTSEKKNQDNNPKNHEEKPSENSGQEIKIPDDLKNLNDEINRSS